MARAKSLEMLGIDEAEFLKTYRLSQPKLTKWEDFDPMINAAAQGPSSSSAIKSARGEEDPLGLLSGPVLTEVSPDLRSMVSTTSKSFNPKIFLSTVHPNASFSDLKKGGARLREGLEQRSEALKILVESEFDRFVAVKASTEVVFEQMKAGPLVPETDYLTAAFKESLRCASSKAEQVYTPILENRKKADRLRSTLGIFERSKFFFNLPGTLIEAIEAEKYDAALSAYKRGKNMLDLRPGQVLNLPAPSNSEELAQQKRIFDKIWSEVQRVVSDFKAKLVDRLCCSSEDGKSIEEIERNIEMILELAPMDDPAWIFCEHQHKAIVEKLSRVFSEVANHAKAVVSQANSTAFKEEQWILDIRRFAVGLDASEAADPAPIANNAIGAEGWVALLQSVRASSEVLIRELETYWKIVKAYADGKYQHADARPRKDIQSRRALSCQQMHHEVVTHYASLLSGFFMLTSDYGAQVSQSGGVDIPDFIPKNSNALTATHFYRRIVDEIVERLQELLSSSIPSGTVNALQDLIEAFRLRSLVTLSALWVRDSKILDRLEDWARCEKGDEDEPPAGTTLYLKRIYNFHRHMMFNLFVLAGGKEETGLQYFSGSQAITDTPQKSKKNKQHLPSQFSKQAQSAFLDALYGTLDGLVHVAFASSNENPLTVAPSLSPSGLTFSLLMAQMEQPPSGSASKEEESDLRVLLTIGNISHLSSAYIPSLFRQFSEAFSVDMSSARSTVMDVIEQLNALLVGDYIKRKSDILAAIIQLRVHAKDVNWLKAPKPTEVHPFIFEVLLNLVFVHAQVTSITGPVPPHQASHHSLVNTILAGLVEELANQCLAAFGSVEKFGMGGMLQATLEIEFMHQTLSAFVTPQADATLQSIYQKISNAYEREPPTSHGDETGTGELHSELEALKRTLHFSRRITALAFVCFKKPKPSSVPPTNERHSGSQASLQNSTSSSHER